MIHHNTHVTRSAIFRFIAILGMVFGMFAPLVQAAPAYALSASQYTAWGWGFNAYGQHRHGYSQGRQYRPDRADAHWRSDAAR